MPGCPPQSIENGEVPPTRVNVIVPSATEQLEAVACTPIAGGWGVEIEAVAVSVQPFASVTVAE